MGWLKDWIEKHPSLININVDLSKLQSIKFLSDVKINSPTIKINEIDSKMLEVTLNPEASRNSSEELEAIKELMRLSVPNAGGLLEPKTEELMADVSEFQSDEAVGLELSNLKGKIPVADLPIWEAALYIKRQHDAHGLGANIAHLKTGIKDRYGDRGRNIANLCTAGYLNDIILPIYNELSSRPDFQIDEFNTQYEVIVMQYPFAVFVARSTTVAQVLREITSKILYNKAYGIHTLNIHSISDDNNRKVLSIIEDEKVTQHYTDQPKIVRDGSVMLVKLYF